MLKLFIHIGTHKTGSSAIQSILRQHPALLRKEGLVYLPAPPVVHPLVRCQTLPHQIIDDGHKQLRHRIGQYSKKGFSNFVMSWEGFSGNPYSGYNNTKVTAESLRKITDGIDGIDVSIIVYLRRQDDFIESLYTQSIHDGGASTFPEFAAQFSETAFNWEIFLQAFSQNFDKPQIKVRVYDKAYLPRKESLLKDFGSVIESNVFSNSGMCGTSNAGYSRDALEIARLTNPYLDDYEKQQLRIIFQHANCKQPFERYQYFSRQEREDFLSRYSASNAAVAKEFFPDSPEELFPVQKDSFEGSVYQGLTVESAAVVLTKAMLYPKYGAKSGVLTINAVQKLEKVIIRTVLKFPGIERILKRFVRKMGLW